MTERRSHKPDRHEDWDSVSELRQDPVSRDWVVVATGRAKRPHTFVSEKRAVFTQPTSECPFEDPQASGNGAPMLVYYADDHPANTPREDGSYSGWSLQVITNKFPAFGHGRCSVVDNRVGPFPVRDGAGFHEVVITRDHDRSLAQLPLGKVEEVVRSYRERYRILQEDDCVQFISIFHNHGKEAGASIAHPHSQIIAIPVLPSDIHRSLVGSERYYHEHKKQCVYCTMLAHDRESGDRVIFENDHFIALMPFVSRTAFEIRIYPQKHISHFSDTPRDHLPAFAEALHASLGMLFSALEDPAYNFFIHTAPVHDGQFEHYHWHVEILPKTQVWAGFELGTGIEISSIRPRDAAVFLRAHQPSS